MGLLLKEHRHSDTVKNCSKLVCNKIKNFSKIYETFKLFDNPSSHINTSRQPQVCVTESTHNHVLIVAWFPRGLCHMLWTLVSGNKK